MLHGQKLLYHPDRLHAWASGKPFIPVYVEINPGSLCNHRCIMCGYDFLKHKGEMLDEGFLSGIVRQLAEAGVKSVMFSGDGEPLLNKSIASAAIAAKSAGLDIAMSTNGTLLKRADAEWMVRSLTWIRFSINACNPSDYAIVHKTKPADFGRAMRGLSTLSAEKRRLGYGPVIGVQLIWLPENASREVIDFARYLKNEGADYFVVKPFCKVPGNGYQPDRPVTESDHIILRELENFGDSDFQISVRWEYFNPFVREYKQCLGTPFLGVIHSDGCMYPCLPFTLGKEDYRIGDLKKSSFKSIWFGRRHRQVLKELAGMDLCQCPPYCRPHHINTLVWNLSNPPPHVNFI